MTINDILKRYFKINNLLDDLSDINSKGGIKNRLNNKGTTPADPQKTLTDRDKEQLTLAVNKLFPIVKEGMSVWEKEKEEDKPVSEKGE